MGLDQEQKAERSKYLSAHLEITDKEPYAFISYASDDWERVFKDVVIPLQKKYGLRVYADKAFDWTNEKWVLEMQKKMRKAAMALVFVSENYVESYACYLELLIAVSKRIEPIFIFLKEWQAIKKESKASGENETKLAVEAEAKKMIQGYAEIIGDDKRDTSLIMAMKRSKMDIVPALEDDNLSNSDVIDAFIEFFDEASVNEKLPDIEAIKDTIDSVNKEVFGHSLASGEVPAGITVSGHSQGREKGQEEFFRDVPAEMAPLLHNAEHGNIEAICKMADYFWAGKNWRAARHWLLRLESREGELLFYPNLYDNALYYLAVCAAEIARDTEDAWKNMKDTGKESEEAWENWKEWLSFYKYYKKLHKAGKEKEFEGDRSVFFDHFHLLKDMADRQEGSARVPFEVAEYYALEQEKGNAKKYYRKAGEKTTP